MKSSISRRHSLFAIAGMAAAQSGPSDLDRIKVGDTAPGFELPSAAGAKMSLDSLRGKNVVLVFYRGYW